MSYTPVYRMLHKEHSDVPKILEEIQHRIKVPTIGLYLTHKCNLYCKHCFWSVNSTTYPELTIDEWKRIIKQFMAIGTKHFHICGREPMLSDKLFNLLEFLHEEKKRQNIRYGIITNGTLIDRSIAARLKGLTLDYVEVSIDGTRSAHDRLRGCGAHQRAMEGLKALLDVGQDISVASIIYKSNVDSLLTMSDELWKSGTKKFFFQPLKAFRPETYPLIISPSVFSVFITKAYEFAEMRDGAKVTIEVPPVYMPYVYEHNQITKDLCDHDFPARTIAQKLDNDSTFSLRFHLICQANWRRARVTADGFLLGCDIFMAFPNYHTYSIGNLKTEEPLSLIIRSFKRGGIGYKIFNSYYTSGCTECSHFHLCGGGCRVYPMLIQNDWRVTECAILSYIIQRSESRNE